MMNSHRIILNTEYLLPLSNEKHNTLVRATEFVLRQAPDRVKNAHKSSIKCSNHVLSAIYNILVCSSCLGSSYIFHVALSKVFLLQYLYILMGIIISTPTILNTLSDAAVGD